MRIISSEKDEFISCFIKCDGGYYTEYGSYARDTNGRAKEFGARLIKNPEEHCMVEFSECVALTDYGKAKLEQVKAMGFKNPHFEKFRRVKYYGEGYEKIV